MRRFALVLHTHLPYVRRNGTWPCGEDFYHQAATDSYLPLIGMLQRLHDDGLRHVATVGITPVLAEQMRDEHLRDGLACYLARYELRAMQQATTYRGWERDRIVDLAARYSLCAREQVARFKDCDGDLTRPFAELAAVDTVELLGGPATHPVLPRTRFGGMQMRTGMDAHERIFGRRPDGVWIPECAVEPGVETLLDDAGVRYAVVDESCVDEPSRAGESDLAVHPLDRTIAGLVWAPDAYPSGEWYRDFHAYDLVAGFKNWRITDRNSGWLGKQIYEPARAEDAAGEHAVQFVAALEDRFQRTDREQIVACFDTELFGHWWFEGPVFLEHVIRLLAGHPWIRLSTLGQLATPKRRAPLRASTWGEGGDFRSWDVPEMWRALSDAEDETLDLQHAADSPANDQMLRELMLLQSSDWPYLVVKGQNAEYGKQRFDTHRDRWSWLADAIRYGKPTQRLVADLAAIDSIPGLPPGLPLGLPRQA